MTKSVSVILNDWYSPVDGTFRMTFAVTRVRNAIGSRRMSDPNACNSKPAKSCGLYLVGISARTCATKSALRAMGTSKSRCLGAPSKANAHGPDRCQAFQRSAFDAKRTSHVCSQ
jgi:hypothetical protein